jgi:hypothetical protein
VNRISVAKEDGKRKFRRFMRWPDNTVKYLLSRQGVWIGNWI